MLAGKVVTNRKTNCSNTIRNAKATTGMNEYWMNDFSHPQNSQSSFGTMKNGTKIGPSSAADGAGDQAEGDDRERQRFRERDREAEPSSTAGSRESTTASGCMKWSAQLVEVAIDIVEGAGFETSLEVVRLIGDQVAERHADPWQWCLIERDQGVAERDEEQQLGEVEHLLTQAFA